MNNTRTNPTLTRRALLQQAACLAGSGVLARSRACRVLAAGGGTHHSSAPILLADETSTPHLHISWPCQDGSTTTYDVDLPYTNPEERTWLGGNLEAYVALGGTRLEKGAGRAGDAILRVGFQKRSNYPMMFAHIANGAMISLTLTNTRFNQPVYPDPMTILQRMEYTVDDIVACGITIDETEMFNMVSPTETMNGSILPTQVRHSCLDNDPPEDGMVSVRVDPDDPAMVSMQAKLPYRLLRHMNDPWGMTVPGTFFEPIQMHLEVEVLRMVDALAEGLVEPDAEQP